MQVLKSPSIMEILYDKANINRIRYESCKICGSCLNEDIRAVSGCYFHLFRSLIRQKGEYLIKPNVESNTYYQLINASKSYGAIDGYRGEFLKPNSAGDDFDVVGYFFIYIDEFRYGFAGKTFPSLNLIMDGTFPTVVSREEALPQQKLF